MTKETRDTADGAERADAELAIKRLTSHVAALEQLIEVHERTSLEQATRLEAAVLERQELLTREREARSHAESANAQLEEQTIELQSQAEELQTQTEELTATNDELQVVNERLSREEARLRENDRQFRTLAESLPQLAWMAEADGYITWYNKRWYDYTGTTPEEMKGWGWQSVHDPGELPRVIKAWRSSIDTGEPFEIEFPLRRADGQFRWFLTRAEPVRDDEGQVSRWLGTNTDIDEQHVVREALREGRERLDAALNASRTGTFRWDIRTDALEWDENLDRLFGLPPGESVRSLDAFVAAVHPDDRGRVVAACERCATEGVDLDEEFRVVWRDESVHWLDDKGKTFLDASGHPAYLTGACVDITELKGLFEAEQLARADAERAQRGAEEANQSKMDFLRNMSHELRTPLNAIGGFTELLEMGIHGPVNEKQSEYLSRVQRSQQHLLGLINDVLNFAKLEAGRVEFHVADVDIEKAMLAVGALIESQAERKSIAFEYGFGPPAIVRADPEKLQQVILNLLSNALKATDAGGRIALGWDADDREIRIQVSDTGIGIPSDKLGPIFEPFVQVGTDERSKQGTGLGLAISRDLARGMQGDLTAASVEGEGSTFTLRLPRRSSDSDGFSPNRMASPGG